MGKKRYEVIITNTEDSYCLGRISGMISAILHDKDDLNHDYLEMCKNDVVDVKGKKCFEIELNTSESKWKKIIKLIEQHYPEKCVFLRIYNSTWLEKIGSN